MAQNVIEVARNTEAIYVKVTGQGNMNNAPTFQCFVDEMIEKGYARFLLDLAPCVGLDSTFMGTLLGILNASAKAEVLILNADSHCRKQLSSIGLDKVFVIPEKPTRSPKLSYCALPDKMCSQQERMRLILKAHEDLIRLDKTNEKKFGAFLRALGAELKR